LVSSFPLQSTAMIITMQVLSIHRGLNPKTGRPPFDFFAPTSFLCAISSNWPWLHHSPRIWVWATMSALGNRSPVAQRGPLTDSALYRRWLLSGSVAQFIHNISGMFQWSVSRETMIDSGGSTAESWRTLAHKEWPMNKKCPTLIDRSHHNSLNISEFPSENSVWIYLFYSVVYQKEKMSTWS
jgi:hypothetical protein